MSKTEYQSKTPEPVGEDEEEVTADDEGPVELDGQESNEFEPALIEDDEELLAELNAHVNDDETDLDDDASDGPGQAIDDATQANDEDEEGQND